MRVLIACEFSGIVREAFKARGHDAWSCDLLPTEIEGNHLQCDVRMILNDDWDLMVGHPPCTYLANSGVQHLYNNRKVICGIDSGRWDKMVDGARFFRELLNAPIARICIENPVQHNYAKESIAIKYNQIVQPYFFGDEAQKKTCLWLKGLPILRASKIVGKGEGYCDKKGKKNGSKWYQFPPSLDRWKHRSRTFQGLASAMAEQWGVTE